MSGESPTRAGQLPRNASGGGGGGDQPAPIQRHRAHRARLDALQASPLALGDELGRIAEGHAEHAGPGPRPLTDEEGVAPFLHDALRERDGMTDARDAGDRPVS